MADFKDVYIVPQYSDVLSRSRVDTTSILDPKHNKTQVRVPVISANMDTVTDGYMARKMVESGAIGAIHRFLPINDQIAEWVKVKGMPCLVSIGVGEEAADRAHALYSAGARHFIIDIAHGHHYLMRRMIKLLKDKYSDLYIMAGNVATAEGAVDLIDWGADAIKVGIGPGAACTTKNMTGVTVPQFTAVRNVAERVKLVDSNVVVVADGGMKEVGDIAKALGAGADFAMCGKMFASCPEAPHPGVYRGMASLDAMRTIRATDKLPTPEGRTMAIPEGQHVEEVVEFIAGGLRSSFSYSNSLTIKEFHEKCKFDYVSNVNDR